MPGTLAVTSNEGHTKTSCFSNRYYVDTTKSPTQSQWHHPLDRPSASNPQQNFTPPPNPPPRSSYASYQPGPGGYNQGAQYVEPERGYQAQQPPPPQPQYAPPAGYEGFRNQGWQQGWQQQQQQPQPGTNLLAREDAVMLKRRDHH
jgi:hypothetical protein